MGTAAAENGLRVKYALATKLVNELVEAADERNLWPRPSPATAVLIFFASTSLATWNSTDVAPNYFSRFSPNGRKRTPWPSPRNDSFSGWTKTFTDPRLCAAIVDRLTFGGNIIETGTDSYRLAHTKPHKPPPNNTWGRSPP